MKIGIIVHSHTGHTLSVAEKLRDALNAGENSAVVERIVPLDDDTAKAGKTGLKTAPDTGTYDMLIFGAPVWAFSLSPVMQAYLSQVPSLSGKKTALFVTQAFPVAWLGGNRAVAQMKKLCREKGAEITRTGVISWSEKHRQVQTDAVMEAFKNL